MNITVRRGADLDPGQREVEIVERKGMGHPDTICDALSEDVSLALCRYYLAQFGEVLHHNVDKILLVGGQSEAWLGGGRLSVPAEIFIAGRATTEWQGVVVPVDDIARTAATNWLANHLRPNFVSHVRVTPLIRPGSTDLRSLYNRRQHHPLANDTSCGAGYAPLTAVERLVLALDRALNDREFKQHHPAIGEDIKVMAVRKGTHLMLTVSCAIVSRYVQTADDYAEQREVINNEALRVASTSVPHLTCEVYVNAADDDALGRRYLAVTGTSAEAGDDGETGRGNRTNGLITPYRPMSVEAAAGKNPITHVGKLYQLLATDIADGVSNLSDDVSCQCVLASRIGRAVCDPVVVDVLVAERGRIEDAEVSEVVDHALGSISAVTESLLRGERRVY